MYFKCMVFKSGPTIKSFLIKNYINYIPLSSNKNIIKSNQKVIYYYIFLDTVNYIMIQIK